MPKVKRLYSFEPKPHFEIEKEIVEYVKWLNSKVETRTRKIIEKEKGEAGFIGQELFEGFLLQYKIPHVYACPLYKSIAMRQVNGKHFDFIIPGLPDGKQNVSVKTVPEDGGFKNIRFMANKKSWSEEVHDIVVVIKIDNLKENKAHIAGWLTEKEVESLPIGNWGNGDAYWTYLNAVDVKKIRKKKKFVIHHLI